MNYEEMQDFLTVTIKNAYLQIEKVNVETQFANNDYVTNCDLIIEKYIIDNIKKIYPNIAIMSEEFNKQNVNGTYFVIDPIDGTANFSTNLDLWGIQIAYIENNDCKVSSIYFPKLNIVVETIKGKGTFINGEKGKIKKSDVLKKSIVSFNTKKALKLYNLFSNIGDRISRVRLFGCPCYSFMLVAKGSIDAYVLIGDTKYDIEPGLLSCKEAGAVYYRDNICTIVANNNEIIDLLKEEVYKVFKED